MQTNVSELVVNQFTRNLKALRGLLGKAKEHANEKKFDPNLFLQEKLSPDMFPFVRQVQITCDTAKGAVARLSGQKPPSWSDEEKSIDELLARVDKTIDYVSQFTAKDFTNYAAQQVSFPWYPNKYLKGDDFLVSHAIPNFFFHLTTTYALLRKSGVSLGKSDFLGEQNWLSN
jgi:hypothetical protein